MFDTFLISSSLTDANRCRRRCGLNQEPQQKAHLRLVWYVVPQTWVYWNHSGEESSRLRIPKKYQLNLLLDRIWFGVNLARDSEKIWYFSDGEFFSSLIILYNTLINIDTRHYLYLLIGNFCCKSKVYRSDLWYGAYIQGFGAEKSRTLLRSSDRLRSGAYRS
jgi:hypothetical protein